MGLPDYTKLEGLGIYSKPKKSDTAPTLTKNVVKKAGAKKAAKKAATGKAKKKPNSYFIPGEITFIPSNLALAIICLS